MANFELVCLLTSEAVSLARIIVLTRAGRLMELGSPAELSILIGSPYDASARLVHAARAGRQA